MVWIWILLGVVVVLLVTVGMLVSRQQRSRRLKEQFGPEYGRVVAERGDPRAAEQELAARRERVSKFEIRELDPAARERYVEAWNATQRHFVDQPAEAVAQSHRLVQQVMQDRGYPVDQDFEQRAADISVEHPDLVENYRAANAISVRAGEGQASTEQLRQAMVHFRSLFSDLLGTGVAGQSADSTTGQSAPVSQSAEGAGDPVANGYATPQSQQTTTRR